MTVVLAAVGGYAFYLSKKGDTTESGSKLEKVFPALKAADDVQELRVSTADGEATTLKKDNGAWQVTAPITAPADASEVNGITAALSSTEITRVVDENPSNLNDYGLSNPKIAIDFKTKDDKDFKKLLKSLSSFVLKSIAIFGFDR